MDYDRKSAVSSFYGGRRSADALNNDFPPPGPPGRTRADSASSFYGADRASRVNAFDGATPTAGYNHGSYFDAGRTEPVNFKSGVVDEEAQAESAWDVYADFNNAGPRYSTAFGITDNGYRQVPSPTPYSHDGSSYAKLPAPSVGAEEPATPGNVEMVTVPALGPEWKADELRNMSKKMKREEKMEEVATKWKQWKRGQRGLCGKWFTKRFLAWFIFGLCAAIALVLVFTIPRVPGFSVNSLQPLSPATKPFNESIPVEFSRAPANFSFPGEMQLQADTGGNFLPLTFNNIHGTIYDLQTTRQVAQGDTGKLTVPAKQLPVVTLPLNFSYIATNDSDQTWSNWYNGCRNKAAYTDNKRPPVQFRLIIDMHIEGLIGKRSTSTDVTDADCPIELPLNSV